MFPTCISAAYLALSCIYLRQYVKNVSRKYQWMGYVPRISICVKDSIDIDAPISLQVTVIYAT
jgi:hypothetical protein